MYEMTILLPFLALSVALGLALRHVAVRRVAAAADGRVRRQSIDVEADSPMLGLGGGLRMPQPAREAAYDATPRARVGTTVVVGLLTAAMLPYDAIAAGFSRSGPEALPIVLIGLAVAGLYLAFIWRYRVSISGDELSVPTFWFRHQRFDLADLRRIDHSRSCALRLHFRGGRRTEILRYLEGRDRLVAQLEAHVSRNAAR